MIGLICQAFFAYILQMKIYEQFSFSKKDYEIWQIYKAYEFYAKKNGDYRKYLSSKNDPRKHKNWANFESVFDRYEKDTSFDPFIFMESQFRNVQKGKTIYPAQLKTTAAEKRYHSHRDAVKISDTSNKTEQIIQSLAATFKFLKKWWKQNNFQMDDYASFFSKDPGELISTGMAFCMQGMISKYFMATSRHFNKEYNDLDVDYKWEVITPNDLKSYRISLKLDEEAYDFAKELFNGEIN